MIVGRNRDYQAGLFAEFEKLNTKLDKLIKENKAQSLTIYNLNLEIEKLNATIQKKEEENKKLLEEIDRLKNKNNKNSSNSSKPSSTNITTPKKKTGANLYNYRVKGNKKVGGQFGHKGHNLSKKDVEDLIDKKKIEVREYNHIINGNSNKDNTIKYKLGIEIKPYVEKHIFKYNENSKEKIPKEFYTDVTYDNSIKALTIELGVYNVISYDRLSDFFNVITNGIIKITNSSLEIYYMNLVIKAYQH